MPLIKNSTRKLFNYLLRVPEIGVTGVKEEQNGEEEEIEVKNRVGEREREMNGEGKKEKGNGRLMRVAISGGQRRSAWE